MKRAIAFIVTAPLLVLLVPAFEAYALTRRRGWKVLEVCVGLPGLVVDVAANYTAMAALCGPVPWRGKSWPERTVTARITDLANDRTAGWRHQWALALALGYLNLRDPNHCKVQLEG